MDKTKPPQNAPYCRSRVISKPGAAIELTVTTVPYRAEKQIRENLAEDRDPVDPEDLADRAGDAFALQTALWTGAVMVGLYWGDLLGVLFCGIGWVASLIRLNRTGWGIGGVNNG